MGSYTHAPIGALVDIIRPQEAAIVDPVDPDSVLKAVKERKHNVL